MILGALLFCSRVECHIYSSFDVRCVSLFFFFFSSRRRHTRFDCDWSSDVCSSDLENELKRHAGPALGDRFANARLVQVERAFDLLRRQRAHWLRERALPPRRGNRSEEHTSELQSQSNLVCRLLLEKKKRIASLPAICVRWELFLHLIAGLMCDNVHH